jgi:hypothetical protein
MGEQLNAMGIKSGLSRLTLENWFEKNFSLGARSFNLVFLIIIIVLNWP